MNRLLELLVAGGVRKYGANTAWLFFEKAVRVVAGLFVGIYVMRQLGPEKFGALSNILSYAAMLASVAPLGMAEILVRELVTRPDDGERLLGTAFLLRMAAAVFVLLAAVPVFVVTGTPKATAVLVMIALSGVLVQSLAALELYFQAFVKGKFIAMSQIAAVTACSLVRLVLAWKNAPLTLFAAVEPLLWMVEGAFLLWFYRRDGGRLERWRFARTEAATLLKASWPLLLSGIAVTVYMRIDQLMIDRMLGAGALGVYAAAVKTAEAFFFIPLLAGAALFPALLNAKKTDERLYRERLDGFCSLMFYGGAVASGVLTVCGVAMVWLYGDAYRSAYPLFAVIVWRLLFLSWGTAMNYYLYTENLQLYSLFFALLGAGFNIAANLLLIGKFGAFGAAWAALATSAFLVMAMPLIFGRMRIFVGIYWRSLNPWTMVRALRGAEGTLQ
ncbi:MAG: flippase [Victivallaceae bacterium]|nr:flippase [Victivallaceae bacterium]